MNNDDLRVNQALASMQYYAKRGIGKFANVDAISEMAEGYLTGRIKNYFGKEFSLFHCNNMNESIHLKAFLSKYDKNFSKHLNNDGMLSNFVTICKLDKCTYMYMASKRFVPGVHDKIMMESKAEDLYVYIFGKKAPKYWLELSKAMEMDYTKDKGGLIFNVSKVQSSNYNITSMDLKKRSFDNLYFSNGEIDAIKKHIERFNESYQMYKEKQLNYKTGILLYGKPGTGKSSLAKAIASEYNRSIAAVSCGNLQDIDFGELTTMLNNDTVDKYVVLLEDVDTVFRSREKEEDLYVDQESGKKMNQKQIVGNLLQFLDSNTSPDNVIFIATTNYINNIDPAILRDGRFDLKVEVKGLDEAEAIKFIKSFNIDEKTAYEMLKEYREDEKYSKFWEQDHVYNQASMQTIAIKHMNPNKSAEVVDNLVPVLDGFDNDAKDDDQDYDEGEDE